MSVDWKRAQDLFLAALEQEPDARPDWIEAVCAGDEALRRAVEALVAGHDEGPLGELPEERPFGGRYPERVGAYRIIRPVGSGGMGTVFLAERELDGFSQTVALKLLHPGLLSADLESRLRAERRILARLEHPGIARLIDGGVTDEGQPFFAMEYVDGVDLMAFAAQRRLGVEARVELLAEVCDAVHYAHQQLVVHRDLKPSNVLVTLQGRPRLLDFGVARVLDDERSDRTRTGAWITPAYASPEQLRGEPVNTLADVYALGVMLYELLTGTRPHAAGGRSAPELLLERTETPPTRPSERAVEEGPTAETPPPETRAAALGLAPARLRRALSGDLDVIVLRALATEPARRYPSAAALADDLRRHLAGLPVEARPDALGYRIGRFVKRHRTAVGIAAAAVAAVLAGTATTAWQAQRATREAEEARRQRDRAETEALRSRRIADLVTGLFELTDPTRTRGDTITALRLLEEGTARVEAELAGDPATQADLLAEVVRVYRNLGLLDRAESVAGRVVDLRADGPPTPRARALGDLGDALAEQGRYAESATRYEEALSLLAPEGDTLVARLEAQLGWSLRSLGEGTRARERFTHALELQERLLGTHAPTTAATRLGLAAVEHDEGRFDEAAALFRNALPEDPTQATPDPGIAQALSDLGMLHRLREEVREAEPLIRTAYEMRRTLFGDDHPETLDSAFQWGVELFGLGRWREALEQLSTGLERARSALGPDHPTTLDLQQSLAQVEVALGFPDPALARARDAVERKRRLRGETHPATVFTHLVVGDAALAAGALDEAEAAYGFVLSQGGTPGEEGVYGMLALAGLARTAFLRGDVTRAAERTERASARGAALLRDDHRYRRDVARLRAEILLAEGRAAEAVELLETTLAMQERLRPAGHPETGWTRRLLAEALAATGRTEEADEARRRAEAEMAQLEPDHPHRRRTVS